jgi:hypothetical protein
MRMKRGLEICLAALAVVSLGGCCAYRGISQSSLVHVRKVAVSESPAQGTNCVAEADTNGVRFLAGRVVVVAENVYVSVGGGMAASNDLNGELSIPLTQ